PVHYRVMQGLKGYYLKISASYNQLISLTEEVHLELDWWVHNMEEWDRRARFGYQPDFILKWDSSFSGWGATCSDLSRGDLWTNTFSITFICSMVFST
ncbi:Hypothetical predicted protein, partial [Pelobates cultripes]